jgi:hypothetical protein
MEYPKFVTRATGIGPVLCLNAAEEKKLLDDWDAEQLAKAEEAAAAAKAEAVAAEEAAKLVLKKQGK